MLMVAPRGIVKDEICLETPIFFIQSVDRQRDRRITGGSGEGKGHNREELFNKLKRIQPGEGKQHDLIYHETLYCQCQNDASHILQHRHKSVEADTCEGLGNQAEDTDRGCFHDCNRHFHHNVIELTEKVRHSGDPVAHGSQKNADK